MIDYITAIQEKKFSVDQEQLKEYFPIDVVTKGMMDMVIPEAFEFDLLQGGGYPSLAPRC